MKREQYNIWLGKELYEQVADDARRTGRDERNQIAHMLTLYRLLIKETGGIDYETVIREKLATYRVKAKG